MSTTLKQLRAGTAHFHQAIESAYPLKCLQRADLTEGQYSDCLSLLQQWYTAVEETTIGALPKTLKNAANYVHSLPALQHDLFLLNDYPELEPVEPLHFEPAEAVGSFYVLVGSSLGSKLILKTLNQLNLTRNRALPVQFYQFNTKNHHAWKVLLETLQSDVLDVEHVVDGAQRSFELLHDLQCRFVTEGTCRHAPTV